MRTSNLSSVSSPLSEGGFRGVVRSPKNLPQPLLEKLVVTHIFSGGGMGYACIMAEVHG